MKPAPGPDNERLSDLLADRAAQGLSPDEAAELERLLLASAAADDESFEAAAAALDAAFVAADSGEREVRALPGRLRARLEAAAVETLAPRLRVPDASDASGRQRSALTSSRFVWGGWLAAAAALTLAAIGWMRGVGPGISVPPTPEATLAGVIARADSVRWSWGAWAAKPAAEGGVEFPNSGVTGEVVWSTMAQAGVMRFVGLAKNNPSELQYQLWIIDPAQKHPIDGGVFNVSADGEALVTIDPKIRVSDAAAFAITAEKPGGVVVSDQSKRVVIAAAPAAKG